MVILLYIKCFHREAKLCFSQEAPRWDHYIKNMGCKGKIYPSECRVPKIARRDKSFEEKMQRNRGEQ